MSEDQERTDAQIEIESIIRDIKRVQDRLDMYERNHYQTQELPGVYLQARRDLKNAEVMFQEEYIPCCDERSPMYVYVLVSRGVDFANVYVGMTEASVCERFCKEVLVNTFSYELDLIESGEDTDEIEAVKDICEHILAEEWIEAVAVYDSYIQFDGERAIVYKEEVKS